ncbi:MAG: gliding motility-associated C-terminal domain-containing protein, partial [Cyclobacteriaceae bacterium]
GGPIPVGELPATVVICNDPENLDPETNQVTLKPGTFESYEWFKNDLSLGISDPSLVVTSEGQYEVLLTNTFNCVAADRAEVINDCVPKIIAPNAFKPGSLISENNNFFIFSLFITEKFHVFIYNRWGEMVFQSSDPDFQWNGGYNNDPSRPLPGGTYAWVVQYVSSFRPNDGIQEKRGGVLLLR